VRGEATVTLRVKKKKFQQRADGKSKKENKRKKGRKMRKDGS